MVLAEWHISPREVDEWTDEQFNLYIGSYIVRRREEMRAQKVATEESRNNSGSGSGRSSDGRTVETKKFTAWDVIPEPYPGAPGSKE